MTTPEEPQVSMSMTDLRDLATQLGQDPLSFDPSTIRKGVVTAVNTGGSPPTLTVNLSGDTTTAIPDLRYLEPYVPAVDDTVLMIKQGTSLVVLNKISESYTTPGTTDYIRWSRSSGMNISHNTITKVAFPTADVTDSTTVAMSNDRDFSLVRSGIYTIETTVPWQGSNLGSRWAWIGLDTDSATRYAVSTLNPNNAAFPIHNVSVTRRFTAATAVSVYVFQDTGGTLALGPGSGIAPLDLNITYIKP